MAATDDAAALTERHRLAQTRIRATATADAISLMALLDVEDVEATTSRWLRANERLVEQMRARSEREALAYLVAFKRAETGSTDVPWRTVPLDGQRVRTSLLLTGPGAIRALSSRGVPLGRAMNAATSMVAGAASRFALEGGRDGMLETVRRDRQVRGWQRVGTADPCAFCLMLISRGPVYRAEGAADFQAHDHCGCTVEPVYRTDGEWTGQARQARQQWNEAQRRAREAGDLERGTANDQLNAFRRYLRAA